MENKDEKQPPQEQGRTVRHTISAEETFTLAKDVYDLRSFIKTVYSNRAVIARRLNLFSLLCSLVFTMFYAAFTVYSVIAGTFSLGLEIAIYCMLGIYVVFVVLLVLVARFSADATTRTVKRYNSALKIFRLCIRVVSIAMAIVAIAASGSAGTPAAIAAETVLISGGGEDDVVVTEERCPQYRGALVVCEGGGSDAVRLRVTEAVAALTGLGADRIAVAQGGGTGTN